MYKGVINVSKTLGCGECWWIVCDIMLNHMAYATIKQRSSRVVSEKEDTKRRERTRFREQKRDDPCAYAEEGRGLRYTKKDYTVQSLPYYSTLVRARNAWLPRNTPDTESWRRALLVVLVPVPVLVARGFIEPKTKDGGEGVHKPD